MANKNFEFHYLNRDNLAEQGIEVPVAQPYNFLENSFPEIGDELRNGLDVKTKAGSPVFEVANIFSEHRDGNEIVIVELKFVRTDPTSYSKVPE